MKEMYEEIDTHVIKSVFQIALAVIMIIPLAFMGAESVLSETPEIKVEKIIEQTDEYVIIKTDRKGNYDAKTNYDSIYSNGYVCYKIKNKGEYKNIDIYTGYSYPIIDGAIKIETDSDDKYICIDVGVNGYALYLIKDKNTNQWKKANVIEKAKYRATHLFAY